MLIVLIINKKDESRGDIDMKNLIKIVFVLLISMILFATTTVVKAADNDTGFTDLTGTLNSSNTSNDTSSGSSDTNTSSSNSTSNSSISNTTNNTTSNSSSSNSTSNSSIYSNNTVASDLPKTGVEDSIPVVLLVVVFGVSAIYAYRKINEYKNI